MLIRDLVAEKAHAYGTRDPFEICKSLKIIVQKHSLVGMRGYHRISNGYHVITLADDLAETTASFVCAHELGHYFLHGRFNRIFMDLHTCLEVGRFENEADKFAAQLLFGQPPLYQEPITAWEMANILNVAVCNVDARLIELGIYY